MKVSYDRVSGVGQGGIDHSTEGGVFTRAAQQTQTLERYTAKRLGFHRRMHSRFLTCSLATVVILGVLCWRSNSAMAQAAGVLANSYELPGGTSPSNRVRVANVAIADVCANFVTFTNTFPGGAGEATGVAANCCFCYVPRGTVMFADLVPGGANVIATPNTGYMAKTGAANVRGPMFIVASMAGSTAGACGTFITSNKATTMPVLTAWINRPPAIASTEEAFVGLGGQMQQTAATLRATCTAIGIKTDVGCSSCSR